MNLESNFWFGVFVNDCPRGLDHGDRIFRFAEAGLDRQGLMIAIPTPSGR